jgi:hypothetical protein
LNLKTLTFAFLLSVLIGIYISPVYADTTFTVSNEAEFIEALTMANNETEYPGEDTIVLAADLSFDAGYFEIASEIVIDGQQHILECSDEGYLHITLFLMPSSATLTLKHLNFTSSNSSCSLGDNLGTFLIRDSTFTGLSFESLVKNEGFLDIRNSTFKNVGEIYNTANGNLTVAESTFEGNLGLHGGAVENEGHASLENVTISDVSGEGPSTAIWNNGGHITITDSIIQNNEAFLYGPNPAIFISGGTVTLLRTQVLDNIGGGIKVNPHSIPEEDATLTITDSVFARNTDSAVAGRGVINITGSTFKDNTTMNFGGGVALDGTISITNSTFSGNSTEADEAGGGAISVAGNVTIANVTISGNSTGQSGGGILNWGGNLTITHSTIVNNLANGAGAVRNIYGGTVTISNSILSNGEDECENWDEEAGVIHAINNLAGDECGFAPVTGLDLTLKDNGGNTWTHALLQGSNAINGAGTCTAPPVNGHDQRGVTRDSQCDIGAYEYVAAIPTATSTLEPTITDTPQSTVASTETPAIEITATTDVSTTNTPVSQVTATPESTLSNTPEYTYTPTTTQVTTVELLMNGSFEDAASGIPDGWTPKNATSDKQKCNKLGKIIAFEGECAYQFKGSLNENSKLQQVVDLSGVIISAGDTLTLSGYVHAKGTVKASVKVRVSYASLDEKGKITVKLNTPTTGYQPLSSSPLLITDDVTGVKVQLANQSPSGKILFDAIGLWLVEGEGLLLLPAAP